MNLFEEFCTDHLAALCLYLHVQVQPARIQTARKPPIFIATIFRNSVSGSVESDIL